MTETFTLVKSASRQLALLTDEQINAILMAVADAIVANSDMLLQANAEDLARMDSSHAASSIATTRSTMTLWLAVSQETSMTLSTTSATLTKSTQG